MRKRPKKASLVLVLPFRPLFRKGHSVSWTVEGVSAFDFTLVLDAGG